MDQTANLIYLIMLLVLVGGAFFTRGTKSGNINHLITWALIILFLSFGYRIYQRMISTPRMVDGELAVNIPFNQRAGGYLVTAQINGEDIEALIDTGATQVVLSYQDAEKILLDMNALSFNHEVSTANGTTYAAQAVLDSFAFGKVKFHALEVLIAAEGDLDITLIGMNLIRRFGAVTISDDKLLIQF